MREIKFRGKNIIFGGWVYGFLSEINEGCKYGVIDSYDEEDGWTADEVDINTIGQYTGLKDRNGKEIYEGDIVNIVYNTHYKTQNYDSFIVCFGRWLYEDDEYADIPHNGWFLKHINEEPLQPKAVSMQHVIETPHTIIEVVGNIHEKQSEHQSNE